MQEMGTHRRKNARLPERPKLLVIFECLIQLKPTEELSEAEKDEAVEEWLPGQEQQFDGWGKAIEDFKLLEEFKPAQKPTRAGNSELLDHNSYGLEAENEAELEAAF
jgi:hypothetical protein